MPILREPTLVENSKDAVHGAIVKQAGAQPWQSRNYVALQLQSAEIAPGGNQDLMRDEPLNIVTLQQLVEFAVASDVGGSLDDA